jgi:GNAT superfamily N-acetyltransferase
MLHPGSISIPVCFSWFGTASCIHLWRNSRCWPTNTPVTPWGIAVPLLVVTKFYRRLTLGPVWIQRIFRVLEKHYILQNTLVLETYKVFGYLQGVWIQ